MNPLYAMFMRNPVNRPAPAQNMAQMMQAMRDPAAFVRQAFPDIPIAIQNDPNQILQYLQQTRNISNEQIQNIINQMPRY